MVQWLALRAWADRLAGLIRIDGGAELSDADLRELELLLRQSSEHLEALGNQS